MKRLLFLFMITVPADCGPTEVEVGQVVLLAMIPITLVGWLLQIAYGRLLERVHEGIHNSSRASLASMGGAAALLLASIALRGAQGFWDLVLPAFVWVGTSYLCVHAATMFVLARRFGGRHFHLSSSLPWLVFAPPAVFCAFAGSDEEGPSALLEQLWGVDGPALVIAGPLVLLVFGFALYERKVHAKRLAATRPVTPSNDEGSPD
ncbi:MAG: hypothetical protein VX498_03680 [Myxococcota bacterium]|nr:hypothetical protein [Myxococcota bacterium]